jgi:hypothetical protein
MKMPKTLTEALAVVHANELHKMDTSSPPWENMSDRRRRANVAAMHSVVQVLDLFNISINIDAEGVLRTVRTPAAKNDTRKPARGPVPSPGPRVDYKDGLKMDAAQARFLGFTGDMCTACGGMQMTRNGSCLKCMACGTTTGCS